MVVCPRCGYEFEPEPPPRKPWLRRDIAPAGVANLVVSGSTAGTPITLTAAAEMRNEAQ